MPILKLLANELTTVGVRDAKLFMVTSFKNATYLIISIGAFYPGVGLWSKSPFCKSLGSYMTLESFRSHAAAFAFK